MVVDDEKVSEIIVQGDDQQVEQMRKELQLSEKGMVYVKGLFEREWSVSEKIFQIFVFLYFYDISILFVYMILRTKYMKQS